jgi:hypothetical protein
MLDKAVARFIIKFINRITHAKSCVLSKIRDHFYNSSEKSIFVQAFVSSSKGDKSCNMTILNPENFVYAIAIDW